MQLKVIIGLVVALGLMGWFAKHQTEQLGATRLALEISEKTVEELKDAKKRLDAALIEVAEKNDMINIELSTAHSEWGKLRNEISKTDKCVNGAMHNTAIDWMRDDSQQGSKGHAAK
jgi:septal ring factor EnvC (AmiA/AmiB activator)